MAEGLGALRPPRLWPLLGGIALWTLFLHGGTLAYNSAFDKDTGDVGFLDRPPPPPRGLALYSMALMAVGAILSLAISRNFFLIYALSVCMSWLYSAPPARLKKRGGWDVVINSIGYGAFTAMAGWFTVGASFDHRDALIFVGFAFLFAAVYPMTQFYQREEDRASGARTLVLVLGDRNAMLFIHGAILLAIASWAIAAWARMLTPLALAAEWFFIAIPSILWLAFAAHWWATFPRYNHKRGFYGSMVLWALTDVALVLAFYYGPFVRISL